MRTDEQKVAQTGVQVTFGGEKYTINPLPIKLSLPWTKKVVQILTGVLPLIEITSDDPGWADALGQVMTARPEQLIDLLFEYARDLDREKVEEVATSAEIVTAFEEVMSIESPLFGMAMRAFAAAAPKSESEKPSSTSSPNGTSTPSP